MTPLDEIEKQLKYLERLLANAKAQKLGRVAQFIQAHIWGIEFALKKLAPYLPKQSTPTISIGGIKYSARLDESLLPEEWHLEGKKNERNRT